ncbi:MAG: hypothetical protein Q4B82_08860 [Alysiella sp.]|uniref:hypothetical protein n=1 Tax=Alysiella sp. TaxID=1872483 RepID=UPI0026DD5082|nr:hypothetical protein [Alysiella sp.]MDO4434670.1 hypothetical protein [Alysiella sp.]
MFKIATDCDKNFFRIFSYPSRQTRLKRDFGGFSIFAIFRLPPRTETRQDTTPPLNPYNALIFGAEHDRYQNQAVVQQRVGFSNPRRQTPF